MARQQGAEVGYALVHGYGAVFDKKMPGKKPGIEYRCNPREERSIVLMILFKHAMAGGDLSERNKSKIDFYWESGEDRS
ncbi:hypothetical protein [Bradyrhizobium elkanii]|uniref:hypothetical protein n=1 Tax=Bradyrhizobium elkanii TaxID=29448 RepID=UPI001BA7EDA6|nr:hypothetical protein [Bradyrhizobium elkanii]MBR1163684.1 hypothetical protein [Bradyrhizobium elkanii]